MNTDIKDEIESYEINSNGSEGHMIMKVITKQYQELKIYNSIISAIKYTNQIELEKSQLLIKYKIITTIINKTDICSLKYNKYENYYEINTKKGDIIKLILYTNDTFSWHGEHYETIENIDNLIDNIVTIHGVIKS